MKDAQLLSRAAADAARPKRARNQWDTAPVPNEAERAKIRKRLERRDPDMKAIKAALLFQEGGVVIDGKRKGEWCETIELGPADVEAAVLRCAEARPKARYHANLVPVDEVSAIILRWLRLAGVDNPVDGLDAQVKQICDAWLETHPKTRKKAINVVRLRQSIAGRETEELLQYFVELHGEATGQSIVLSRVQRKDGLAIIEAARHRFEGLKVSRRLSAEQCIQQYAAVVAVSRAMSELVGLKLPERWHEDRHNRLLEQHADVA